MRVLFLTLIISLLTLSGCSKREIEYQSVGTITGPDLRSCLCCGGWFIEIEDNTYRFEDIPNVNDLDLKSETFPLNVKLNYSLVGCGCLGDEIEIGNIVKSQP